MRRPGRRKGTKKTGGRQRGTPNKITIRMGGTFAEHTQYKYLCTSSDSFFVEVVLSRRWEIALARVGAPQRTRPCITWIRGVSRAISRAHNATPAVTTQT
jgi:hypothetical protein